jgi:hypothetical protein
MIVSNACVHAVTRFSCVSDAADCEFRAGASVLAYTRTPSEKRDV